MLTNRRHVLRWMVALGTVSLVARYLSREDASGIVQRLASLLAFPGASAAAIGTAYLAVVPNERSRDLLEQLVAAAMLEDPGVTRRPIDAEVFARFEKGVRADFESSNVVSVAGWLLSRTEARLCARISLGEV